ncbi:MAG: carbon-nitrogen hydrolase family protein [bacterium]
MNTDSPILKVAIIQLSATTDQKKNLEKAISMVKVASQKKVDFILLPEVYTFRRQAKEALLPNETCCGPSIQPFLQLAKESKSWILCGSIYEKAERNKRYNTSILINDHGEIDQIYRKIHLFSYTSKERKIDERREFLAGKQPAIGRVKGHKVGLSICYDLRFPELYRLYARLGAELLTVPSCFTKPTGKAHWHTLCRARAIENACFVCAPNQIGIGPGGIESFGHSLVVDPWGNILAEASENKEEIIYACLDFNELKKIRQSLPVLTQRCL